MFEKDTLNYITNLLINRENDLKKDFSEAYIRNDRVASEKLLDERNTCNEAIVYMDTLTNNIGEVSDGSHTFDELYYHRMMLFAVICNTYKEHAWKSWKHHDDTMYDDYFIVGVTTPEGDYSYHYHKKHWKEFDVTVLRRAPEYDGHVPSDIGRLLSLLKKEDK